MTTTTRTAPPRRPPVPGRSRGRPSLSLHGQSPQISIRVSAELWETLQADAKAEGVTLSLLVRKIVSDHLTTEAAEHPAIAP